MEKNCAKTKSLIYTSMHYEHFWFQKRLLKYNSKRFTFLGILDHCKDYKDVFCALDPDFKLNLSAKLFVPC
jgi:hypothetical protein